MTIVEWATAGLELANEKGKTVDDLIVYLKNAEGVSRLFDKLSLQPVSKTDADVRPVVRCGECKHCVEHYDTDGNSPYWVCKEWDSGTDYDGYCYHGEKKGR